MKTREKVLCKIDARGEPGPLFVDGEKTVFGLVITPSLPTLPDAPLVLAYNLSEAYRLKAAEQLRRAA